MKKLLLGMIAIPLILVALAVSWFYTEQRQMFNEPSFDTQPPELSLTDGAPAVLVFSKTNGFRHKDGIPAGQNLLRNIAKRNGWQIVITENGAVHNTADLSRFTAVIWANASGPLLLPEQRTALRSYIESGGGFVAIHASGDGSHKDWSWYHNTVIGSNFIGHTILPHKQTADISVDPKHPVMAGLPKRWSHYDEWYAFDKNPELAGATVIAFVDESTYDPGKYSMTPTHPVIWTREPGKGRVLYSALGHSDKSFETPEYQQLIEQAIRWVGRMRQTSAPPTGD